MFKSIFVVIAALLSSTNSTADASVCGRGHENYTQQVGIIPQNNCIQFSVAAGTGCAWMCSYCANQLGTFNYYFPDSVCSYQTGGCVGNPIAGKTYSCCSV